jgi:hypothetical protein
MTWTKELGERGQLKKPGNAVQPTGKIVRDRKRTTADVVIDHTLIGGVAFIEARDLDHAVEISTGCPIFDSGGTVEVRPVMTL